MLRLASDEDVHGDIIRGLRRRLSGVDLLRAQDRLSEGASDSEILVWAANEARVLITNDRKTMVGLAYERATNGELVFGLIATSNQQSIGSAIEDILMIAQCMTEVEIRNQVVVYLPL